MGIVRNKIFESPDSIVSPEHGWVEWDKTEFEPVVFGWYEGKLYFSDEIIPRRQGNDKHDFYGNKDKRGRTHKELAEKNELQKKQSDGSFHSISRNDFKYPGRLWKKAKIVSFWKYPALEVMQNKLRELDDALGTNILSDPEWRVEIFVDEKYDDSGKISNDKDSGWQMIPVSKYTGSDKVNAKELAKQHVASPMDKIKKPNSSGFFKVRDKKEKPLAWKQAMYAEGKKEIVRSSINESPDGIEADNLWDVTGETDLPFYNSRALPFGYYEGKMRVGKDNETHGDIHKRYKDIDDSIDRYDFKYGGRLWPLQKVISFWNYPSPNELKKVLNDIQEENQKKYGESYWIDFKDPNWSIEIISKKLPVDPAGLKQEWDAAENAKLIPFSEYEGSANQSAQAQAKAHVDSPMKKIKRPDRSDFFKERDKKEKPLAWKQAMLKSESYHPELNEKLLMGEPLSVPELRDLLNKKVINFEFIKLDGEVRPAKGTTMMKYVPKDQQPSGDKPSSDKVAAFFDLSKGEWRSVSNRSDEIVIKRDEETGKPKIVVSDKKPKEEPTKPSMPKEKDVEQRPLTPKTEPVVRPSVRPEEPTPIPKPEEIEEPEEETPLDIGDPNIQADEVEPEEIVVSDEEEVPEIEEPEEPSQNYDEEEDVSEELPDKADITFPPDEEDITFPDDEEDES